MLVDELRKTYFDDDRLKRKELELFTLALKNASAEGKTELLLPTKYISYIQKTLEEEGLTVEVLLGVTSVYGTKLLKITGWAWGDHND